VTPAQARAQIDGISGALALQYPDDDKNVAHTIVTPEQDRLVQNTRKPLWIMLGAVSLVLLIGCANVANLLLARGTNARANSRCGLLSEHPAPRWCGKF
jgi:putative ABC transport system permease protein